MSQLTSNPYFLQLQDHYQQIRKLRISDFFSNPDRWQEFTTEAAGLFLDYSKNHLDLKGKELLIELAKSCDLKNKIQGLFSGAIVNPSENRPALHTALRSQSSDAILVNGLDIIPEIRQVKLKMADLVTRLQNKTWRGFTDQAITDIVNIGIGGSDLGPKMVCQALAPYWNKDLKCHFVSNIDGEQLAQVLAQLNPQTTLFIVSSKSFTTIETLSNAEVARQWLLSACQSEAEKKSAVAKHFIAISANVPKAENFGILAENVLPIWDWVGGRYSLWSAIGLPIALATSYECFEQLLAGAAAMDQHFLTADFAHNMPVILGLLSVWYNNFFGAETHAILPYVQNLQFLVDHLQQLIMESNGKNVDLENELLNYQTSPIVWGGVGSNAQHAFLQLFHQGTKYIPCDFIATTTAHYGSSSQHKILLANALAQAQTLMLGFKAENYKSLPGNKPSNFILSEKITPFNLGALIALYEHKIFVESVIWNINSFDQWGVERGKKLANEILSLMENKSISPDIVHDPSTKNLVARFNG